MTSLFRPAILLAIALLLGTPRPGVSQEPDTALARIERLVVAGDRSSARYLADSLINALPPDSPRLSDALYWRAASSASAANAERDYLRISVEHPFSKRAPDALLALAQLEFARGNRAAARRRYDQLLLNYPKGRHVARASLWSGRLALEDQDYTAGCATLNSGRAQVGADDIELKNQFDYYAGQCDRIPAAPDTTAVKPPEKPVAPSGPEFSVQAAAYTAREDALSLANNLKGRGLDARVVGTKAPYRVRIGRYATKAEASEALAKMKPSGSSWIVVEAELR